MKFPEPTHEAVSLISSINLDEGTHDGKERTTTRP